MRPSVVLLTLLLLAACDKTSGSPASSENAPSIEQSQEARPVLMLAGLDVVPEIEKAGSPWSGQPIMDHENWTSGVALYRRSLIFTGGSIDVDRTDDGSVFMVAIQSGSGDRCGKAVPLTRAMGHLLESMQLPVPQKVDVEQLQAAWQSNGGEHIVALQGLQIKAIGGCLKRLSVKAT